MLEHANATARVRTVIAETDVDHVASRRVMEKAGMQLLDTDGRRVRYGFSCIPAVRSAL
jgi:RimJ/RimL family protein N-acetyltransferase